MIWLLDTNMLVYARNGVAPVVRRLDAIARSRGQTLPQMALAWVLRDERVTSAVIGASSVEQLEANVKALDGPPFEPAELAEIEACLA